MPLIVYGISHKKAPLAIREQVAVLEHDLPKTLHELQASPHIHETVILSTCNRTEIYCVADHMDEISEWFGQHGEYADIHQAEAAATHIMRVACGLDSMVLGEPQILGQMKRAFATAKASGSVKKNLSRLFEMTFQTAKMVRTQTAIGEHPLSLPFASVKLALKVFTDFSQKKVLLIGSGEMIELAAQHLQEQQVKALCFANRTLEKAQHLAHKHGSTAMALNQVPAHLHEFDMLITATASEVPIIGKGSVESAMRLRKNKAMVLVDLAVPRDIEPEIKSLDNVYLFDIDALQSIVASNLKSREQAALKAHGIVEQQVATYFQWLETQKAVKAICAYREHHEKIRDDALEKAHRSLVAGKPIAEVVESLAHTLTNKLLHLPTLQLKEAIHFDTKLFNEWSVEIDEQTHREKEHS